MVSEDATINPSLYLSPNEQDLLVTALNSNKPPNTQARQSNPSLPMTSNQHNGSRPAFSPVQHGSLDGLGRNGSGSFTSPVQKTPGSGNLGIGLDESPFQDYDIDDGNFDWDQNGDQMFGGLPGVSGDDDDTEHHDKRRHSEEQDDEDEEGGGKRREGDEKGSKKPGRKPLTSEPTTKRKAQNRAAQRAFRERKERHLKELENKVDDLEKASESTNHENGLLRAQVDRLSSELKEYRKRVSLNHNGVGRSPPATAKSFSQAPNFDVNNNFQFEFPKFGEVQEPTKIHNAVLQKQHSLPEQSPRAFAAPNVPRGDSITQSPPGMDELSSLFSPEILANASRSNSMEYAPYGSRQNMGNKPHANSMGSAQILTNSHSGSIASTASPSASSISRNGVNTSCDTSPEPSADSPQHKTDQTDVPQSSEGVPNLTSFSQSDHTASVASSTIKTPSSDLPNFDWMAQQNGGTFDPVLFGDYRDPQENIMNDFGDFFNEAYPLPDFASPSNLLPETAKAKTNIIQEIEETQAGQEPVTPAPTTIQAPKQFLTCNMLWDRVQKSDKVQSGEVDMDDLCAQLKSKAKCSGSGAVIDQDDVNAILGPPPNEHVDFLKMFS